MKNLLSPEIDMWRDRRPETEKTFEQGIGNEYCGRFFLPCWEWLNLRTSELQRPPAKYPLFFCVIAAGGPMGKGWDHISISARNRCPMWHEMEFMRRMFFEPDETCMQLHVPLADHINRHPNTLHIWRPQLEKIPLPPAVFV